MALIRLGKFSFLLFCMMAILMAPLSLTASARTLAPDLSTEKPIVSADGFAHQSDVADAVIPCDTPNCCDGCTDNRPAAPSGCAQCDAGCQSSGSSMSAVLRHTTAKMSYANFVSGALENNVSMPSFRPEAANPPPRA